MFWICEGKLVWKHFISKCQKYCETKGVIYCNDILVLFSDEITGHFVLVIMWMYDVLLQVCLAIAHYSHPADPQLLFGFEYVGKRYHGSTGRKTLMRLWPQITRVVSTRAAKLSWAIHTFSFPASQDMRRLSRECKELVLWIAGPYNKIYMAAIIGLHCNV